MRFIPLLLLAALVGGCPHHEANVETTVTSDGTVTRRMVFRETEKNRVWGFFATPEAPYELSGSPEKGMVATAKWHAGTNQGGLRFWLEPKEFGANRKATRASSVVVSVKDLVIGKLCVYRERIDLGIDPVLVRVQLERWLDLGAAMLHEALSIRFKGTDLGPLKKHFDENLKPRLLASALRLQLVAAALMRDWQNTRVNAEEPGWLHNPFVKVVLDEMKLWGVLLPVEANIPWLEQQVERLRLKGQEASEDYQARLRKWFRGQLGPGLAHLDQAKRDEMFTVLFGNDEAFEKAMKEATRRRFPEEADQEKVQREALAFAMAFLGAGVHALFEDVVMDFRLSMPGRVVHTNGELGRGAVLWRVSEAELWFVGPMLHATSVELVAWARRAARRNNAGPRLHTLDRVQEFMAKKKELKLAPLRAIAAIDDDAKRAVAARGLHGDQKELWERLMALVGGQG